MERMFRELRQQKKLERFELIFWRSHDTLGQQADMRDMAGQLWGNGGNGLPDLGRPQTPRKEGKEGSGAVDSESTANMSILGNGSVKDPFVFNGGGQLPQKTNAPMADSALSSVGGPPSVRQGFELDSVIVRVDGQKAKIKLTDVRKQLMTVGLFPPEFYAVGETFEEMRLRYNSFPLATC